MAIEAQAKITLRGGSEALKTLQGITRQTTSATKAQRDAARQQEQAQRAAIRAHQQRMREEDRAIKATSRAQETAAKSLERLQEREAQRWQRLAQQSAHVREKAMVDATRVAQREAAKQLDITRRTAAAEVKARQDAWRKAGGLLAGIGGGLATGAVVAAGTARSVAGAKGMQERIQAGNDFRERLTLSASSAGLTADEREGVQAKIMAASTKTGSDAGALLGVVEQGQAQFNSLRFFADNIEEIATISRASGAETEDLAVALGYMRQAFGLTDKEALESAYLIKSAADKGSVEMKNFAKDFAAGAGIFATNTGQKGIAGVKQMLGTAQAIGSGGFGSAESATRFERFATDLNDVEVQKGLKGIGVSNYRDSAGKIDVGQLITQLSGNAQFKNAGVRQGIFKETRTLQAVEALIAAGERGRKDPNAVSFDNIVAGSNVDAGKASVGRAFNDLSQLGSFKFAQENARMQAETTANLQKYNDQLLRVLETSNKVEETFGSMSLWKDSLFSALGGGALLTTLLNKGNGGGGASLLGRIGEGAATAMPTFAGAASKATGGIGSLIRKLTELGTNTETVTGKIGSALGVLGAAYAGYEAGTAINEWSADENGDKWSDKLGDWLFESLTNDEDSARNRIGGTTTNGNTDGTGGAKEIVRVLKEIDSGLRAQNEKPQTGGSREPR